MRRNVAESIVGAVVLIVALGTLFFAWRVADVRTVDGYRLTARFLNVGGLEVGSDVRINGVKVGTVVSRSLDRENFEAVIVISIGTAYRLPVDSQVSIASNGLLGGKYVRIQPGSATEMAAVGGELTKTVDHKSLEDTVAEIIYLATGAN